MSYERRLNSKKFECTQSQIPFLERGGFTFIFLLFPTMTIPSAKSSREWTPYDLALFNIQIVSEGADTFFGKRTDLSDVPIPKNVSLNLIIWNSAQMPPEAVSKYESRFFTYMQDTYHTSVDPDCDGRTELVIDFVLFLLGPLLKYDAWQTVGRGLHTRMKIPYEMCGTGVEAEADVVLTECRWGADVCACLLLVQVYDVRTRFALVREKIETEFAFFAYIVY